MMIGITMWDRRKITFCFVLIMSSLLLHLAEASDDEDLTREERRAKRMEKVWYLRKIEVAGKKLPMSPVSLAVGFLSLYVLITQWSVASAPSKKVYCEASHILIMDHSKATKDKLLEFQQKIQSDPQIFAKMAKKHSGCPSKSNGGNLGKFKPGDMAPPFDKLCFDPATPMQTTVGPVQTNFGWHLIYIHERKLP